MCYVLTTLIPEIFLFSNNLVKIRSILYFSIAIGILITGIFAGKINIKKFGFSASAAILILSLLFYFTSEPVRIFILFIMAAIFSVGVVLFFSFFEKIISPEERGRISGMIAFIILPFVLFLELIPAEAASLYGLLLILCMFILIISFNLSHYKHRKAIYRKNFEKKYIFMYLLPWISFSIVNATLAQTISIYVLKTMPASTHLLLISLQVIGTCIGAITAGFLTDFFGRKLTLILSLTVYGASAVIGGILQTPVVFSAMYFLNGVSWGLLFVIYIFVVWADFSNQKNSGKMYSLGLSTYFISLGLGLISPIFLPITISSLLICLIMFLSLIPLFLSPEITPTDFIEKMKLKQHINKIKKISKNQG
jgi:hypothetical protein